MNQCSDIICIYIDEKVKYLPANHLGFLFLKCIYLSVWVELIGFRIWF